MSASISLPLYSELEDLGLPPGACVDVSWLSRGLRYCPEAASGAGSRTDFGTLLQLMNRSTSSEGELLCGLRPGRSSAQSPKPAVSGRPLARLAKGRLTATCWP